MKRLPTITYYDHADLNYASFFLSGLHELAAHSELRLNVSSRQPAIWHDCPDAEQWRPILFSILLFKFECEGEAFHFCIDTRDSNKTGGSGRGYHLPLLDRVKYYFKVNYNADEIARDMQLAPHAHKIIPVPPFFPTRLPSATPYLPMLKWHAGWGLRDAITRVRQLAVLSRLADLRTLRNAPKVRDVFFLVGYYDRHERENEFRYQIMSELRARPHICCDMGFVGRDLPGKYRAFQVERELPLRAYLSEIAASRVAVYVRGVHECLSFKFGQLLAMGMPMVGQPIFNQRAHLMSNPYFDQQFAYEEPRQIVDRIEALLAEPEALARIGQSNAAVYDQRYTPEHAAGELLACLSGPATGCAWNRQTVAAV